MNCSMRIGRGAGVGVRVSVSVSERHLPLFRGRAATRFGYRLCGRRSRGTVGCKRGVAG